MYFEVLVKMGHVGKGHYIRQSLFIAAVNGKQAAERARWCPRVKHDKMAILYVKSITLDEYINGRIENDKNPFFKATNIQQQRQTCDSLAILTNETYDLSSKSYNSTIKAKNRAKLSERNPKKYQYKYLNAHKLKDAEGIYA